MERLMENVKQWVEESSRCARLYFIRCERGSRPCTFAMKCHPPCLMFTKLLLDFVDSHVFIGATRARFTHGRVQTLQESGAGAFYRGLQPALLGTVLSQGALPRAVGDSHLHEPSRSNAHGQGAPSLVIMLYSVHNATGNLQVGSHISATKICTAKEGEWWSFAGLYFYFYAELRRLVTVRLPGTLTRRLVTTAGSCNCRLNASSQKSARNYTMQRNAVHTQLNVLPIAKSSAFATVPS